MDGGLPFIAAIQSLYFAITGVWPIVHMRSFLAVTGPKTDLWLVRTVGMLITIIGVAIGLSAWQGQIGPSILVLAVGSSLGLAAIDVIYVARRVIAPVYLLDAAAEGALIAAWLFFWLI